jgi:hypothetical protein
MKTNKLASLLPLSLLLLAACGGNSVPAAVAGASPQLAYRGRTLDVVLSGSGTQWDDKTTVTFGDGVTVNKVTLASPAALVANITVAPDAMIGPRDITVTRGGDVEPFKMAFQIDSAIDVQVQGTTAQGSLVFLTIVNKDLSTLFDDTSTGGGLFSSPTFTNIDITAPTGMAVNVSNVTPFRVDATLFIDVNATPGKFDLVLKSGPAGGTQQTFQSPGLFDVAARTAAALTGNTSVSIDKPYVSSLYTLTPGGANHLVTIKATPDDKNQSPSIVVLDNTGSWANLVTNGASVSWLASDAKPVYVIVFDGGGEGGYNVSVAPTDVALTVQTGEGNDNTNKDPNGATLLMAPPVELKGATLTDKNDVDCYQVPAVPAGKSIHARTVPGDANTDTTLQFFASDKTTKLNDMPIDSANHEDAVSPAVASAGDYYVCVGAGSFFSSSDTAYDLIVTIE